MNIETLSFRLLLHVYMYTYKINEPFMNHNLKMLPEHFIRALNGLYTLYLLDSLTKNLFYMSWGGQE